METPQKGGPDSPLAQEVAKRKKIFYLYVVLLVLITAFAFYDLSQHEVSYITFLPLFFIPLCFMTWKRYKQVADQLDDKK